MNAHSKVNMHANTRNERTLWCVYGSKNVKGIAQESRNKKTLLEGISKDKRLEINAIN